VPVIARRVLRSVSRDPGAAIRKAFGYPAFYADALAARRAVRALPAALTPPELVASSESFSWRGSGGWAAQAREEILWLLELVRELEPRTVLEIGIGAGGTLFFWSRVAAEDALLVSVDINSPGIFGRGAPFSLVAGAIPLERQRLELLLGVDSHDPQTVAAVESVLADRPLDFLFIDGDHSYEGVKSDFELYAPLVRPGGVVALHDVAPRLDAGTGVPRFWKELKAEHETEERVAADEPSFGIGVVRVRDDKRSV
jgi:predicted O-methyltransferase YrrM